MSRPDPKSPPPVGTHDKSDWVKQVRKYKLITPLYGGGEDTQKADSITTIRATEVRGHLRFWWRATRGGEFNGNLDEMKKREDVIWGSSASKDKTSQSRVVVLVKSESGGVEDHPFEVVAGNNNRPQVRPRRTSLAHPYAAFPLQPEQSERPRVGMETKAVMNGVTFSLEVQYHADYQKEVEAALWAWENFGGIGARTRRGFGALYCYEVAKTAEPSPSSTDVPSFMFGKMKVFVPDKGIWPPGVPHLSMNKKRYRFTGTASSPDRALTTLIDGLKNFRQKRRAGAEQNRPGRSYWPEPEEIRARTNQRHADHQPLPDRVEKFPRAKFGLPIIFHFKDSNRNHPNDAHFDPRDTTLQGANHDRLASPLILRPIACSDGAVGLATILEWEPLNSKERYTPPGGLILKGAPGDPAVLSDLDEAEADAIPPLHGTTDVLQAFLDSLN